MLMYSSFIPGVLSVLLQLTKTLWNPSALSMFLAFATGFSSPMDVFPSSPGEQGRCMTYNETRAAISSTSDVGGFYGPGAYLAWLITAWAAAISSIAGAKLASSNPERLELDLELIAVVSYPLIAAFDVIWRLLRCKIDATMAAASSVIITSLAIVSPLTRLSVQTDGKNLMDWIENPIALLENKRWFTLVILRSIGHGTVCSIIGEPYTNSCAIITLWILLFFAIIYSGLTSGERYIKDKFLQQTYRPWQERVAFFCMVQIILGVVLVTTGNRSFWPLTSASFWDLDQATTVLVAVVNLVLSRKSVISGVLKYLRTSFSRWRARGAEGGLLRGDDIPLQHIVTA